MRHNETLEREYEAGWKITDTLPVNSVGIATARNELVVALTCEEIRRRVEEFRSRPSENARAFYLLRIDTRTGRWNSRRRTSVRARILRHFVKPTLYRPFDELFT